MNKASVSILFASVYLLVFLLMLHTEFNTVVWTLFLLSPFVVLYMVIRYGVYSGRELDEDEEWGYEDVDKKSI